MRSVLAAILLIGTSSHADPPRPAPDSSPKSAPAPAPAPAPQVQPRTLPSSTLQDIVQQAQATMDHNTGGPSMDGGHSMGIVIQPPPHADAQPWPHGAQMSPPETGDRMLIASGTSALASDLRAATGWSKRFVDAVVQRAGELVELVLPRSI